MLFNSLGFLIFFPVVFFSYWAFPGRFRPWLLLAASFYFYMSFIPAYALVLVCLISIDYALGRAIARKDAFQRFYFVISILSNIGTLFVFKYFNFINENLASFASFVHWNYSLETFSLLLPLGLSFHVFQSLAYIIEVYKGRYPAEKNYGLYALYVMFFPQLVAGPIERPGHLLPQLHTVQAFQYDKAVSGLRLMLWGFFKKIAIANNLALLVDYVYAHLGTADASLVLVAVIAFSFQLYADFSGYSDIALGAARMLGIELSPNFMQPYFSRSIAELWRRWHISLSSWFRDYVYAPLAWRGRGSGPWWMYGSIIITFALTGLWHGAGWNFLTMGVLFGVYITVGESTKRYREWCARTLRLPGLLRAGGQTLFTFCLASLTWVFFRAQDMTQAFDVFHVLLTKWGNTAFAFLRCNDYCTVYSLGISRWSLFFVTLSILFLLVVEYTQYARKTVPSLFRFRSVRWAGYYAFLAWLLSVGYFMPKTFIYFQF